MDILSTLQKISEIREEANPLARRFMSRIGHRKAIWIVFLLAIGIIGMSTVIALRGGFVIQNLFFIGAILLSLIQAAVALSNWQGKDNFITKYVRTGFSALQRWLSKTKLLN